MPLDFEMLSKALFELALELRTKNSWLIITEESGVSNVKNIAEGRIKISIESWYQLHHAFPDKIPPPQTKDGEVLGDQSVSYTGNKVIF